MTLHDTPLWGQSPSCRDFQDKEFRQTTLPLEHTEKTRTENPTLLISNDNQTRILCVLNGCYPGSLRATQICEATYIHRSTVSVNTRELIELGLVEKAIVPGTANHINPTLLFRLSDLYKEEVESFLSAKIKVQPNLWAVYPPEPKSDSQAPSQEPVINDVVVDETVSNTEEPIAISFEEQVKQAFQMMAERLVAMQDEIDELRQRLNEKPRPQTDLSGVFEIFASRSSHNGQGVK